MTPEILQMIISIALTALGLVIVVLRWKYAKWRTLVTLLGLSLLPLGLYLLGLVPLLVDGWTTMSNWYWTTMAPWNDPVRIAGTVVGGLGILLLVISRFIPSRPRAIPEASIDVPVEAQRRPVQSTPIPTAAIKTEGSESTARIPTTQASDDDEDAEITEILKRRGIA